jgi:branched-chain amino acid transport system ATP-binding protein
MAKTALETIRDEHRALAAVLRAMGFVTQRLETGNLEPDFRLLSSFVDYIVRLPDEYHHPKEDRVLFPMIRAACPDAIPILEELERQHEAGGAQVQDLAMSLVHYQAVGQAGQDRFIASANSYVAFQWAHIEIEERDLFPLARNRLTPDQWQEIDASFAVNANPWRGTNNEFAHLFSRITALVPAPMGLG